MYKLLKSDLRNYHSTNRFVSGAYRLGKKFFKTRTTGEASRFRIVIHDQ